MDGDQRRVPAGLLHPDSDGENPLGASYHHLGHLIQHKIPAQLAHGDDQILPGDHDNLGKIGAQLQRPQGM